MGLRAATKKFAENVSRCVIKKIEPDSIALIPRRQRHEAWFSYDLQLEWLLNLHRVDLVVDVGANEGQFARRLRHVYDGAIMSFEPVSRTFARLSNEAHGDRSWSTHQLALGNEEGKATIHVADDTSFSSLLVANEFSRSRFRRSAVLAEEVVEVKRLDDVLAPVLNGPTPRRVFLKLDTQGYDLRVFEGMGDYAGSVVMMQSEISLVPIYEGMPHWTESIATFESAGLHVAGMFPVTRAPGGRVIEYDCLLVREREARG